MTKTPYHALIVNLIFLWFCSACGATTTTASFTPDQVHRQWVLAMLNNDRAKAVEVLSPSLSQEVDRVLNSMQVEQNSQVLGPLVGQPDILVPTAVGAGMKGRSTWKFQNKTECYDTSLAQVDNSWKVTDWQRTVCQ